MPGRSRTGARASRELRRLAVSLAFIVVVLVLWRSGVVEDYLTRVLTDAITPSQP